VITRSLKGRPVMRTGTGSLYVPGIPSDAPAAVGALIERVR